jgi:hypothetical protein
MKSTHIKGLRPEVTVSIVLKVPPSKVDKVSQALVDVASRYNVYDGGTLSQGDLKFEYEPEE